MNIETQNELILFNEMFGNSESSKDGINNFLDVSDYEDDYSHNEIALMHSEFMKEAKRYLETNHKGKYVVYSDWCVHVATVEFCKEHGFKESFIARKIC